MNSFVIGPLHRPFWWKLRFHGIELSLAYYFVCSTMMKQSELKFRVYYLDMNFATNFFPHKHMCCFISKIWTPLASYLLRWHSSVLFWHASVILFTIGESIWWCSKSLHLRFPCLWVFVYPKMFLTMNFVHLNSNLYQLRIWVAYVLFAPGLCSNRNNLEGFFEEPTSPFTIQLKQDLRDFK